MAMGWQLSLVCAFSSMRCPSEPPPHRRQMREWLLDFRSRSWFYLLYLMSNFVWIVCTISARYLSNYTLRIRTFMRLQCCGLRSISTFATYPRDKTVVGPDGRSLTTGPRERTDWQIPKVYLLFPNSLAAAARVAQCVPEPRAGRLIVK